jgi:hypothetical protein
MQVRVTSTIGYFDLGSCWLWSENRLSSRREDARPKAELVMIARPLRGGTAYLMFAIALGAWASPVAFGEPSGPDTQGVKFFRSPSGNIHCEIDYQRGYGNPDTAYCVSWKPPQHVSMNFNGVLTVCNGESCLSNGPEDEVMLPYNETTALGPFACSSKVSGVTCTVDSGRGFAISHSGITPVAGP